MQTGALGEHLVGLGVERQHRAPGPAGAANSKNLDEQAETFKGGTIEGFIYYVVSNEDAGGKLLAFDPNVNYTDVPGGVGFFAVN